MVRQLSSGLGRILKSFTSDFGTESVCTSMIRLRGTDVYVLNLEFENDSLKYGIYGIQHITVKKRHFKTAALASAYIERLVLLESL